jgi:hypothetical protein
LENTFLSDEKFFSELLDCSLSGLEQIPQAAADKKFELCRKIFADYIRNVLRPEKFFNSLREKGKVKPTDDLIDKAEKACRHYMVSCGIPYDYGSSEVDWFFNPTYNNYSEWTWQLSRHDELVTLSRAYRATGDEKYARACAELMESWISQALPPKEPCSGYDTLCWRTIECGIRQGVKWPEIVHTFYKSPSFGDDLIVDIFKSIFKHGERLKRDHRNGNWLIMEMNGLIHIGILYPFFKLSEDWYEYAMNKLIEELDLQIYPDGFQYELTTGYQNVVIINYMSAVALLEAYGRAVPQKITDAVNNMLMLYIKLMKPDKTVPDLNDGSSASVKSFIEPVMRQSKIFADNAVFRWIVSNGKDGEKPKEASAVLDYSGIAVFRTGWEENDSWLLFDGGPFGEAHQHEDKLQVLFHSRGKTLLCEGNVYAYDSSKMRDYVLSTRAHNTVRVDGMCQNRRKNYEWKAEEINKKSDIKYYLSEKIDAANAVYNEGYGENGDKSATHQRNVYFLKKQKDCAPFAVISDRLFSEGNEHDYEILWHLDVPKIEIDGMRISGDDISIITPGADIETAGLSVCRGQQFPEVQGWFCNSSRQKDFRPVFAAQYRLCAKSIRWVTVIYPSGAEECPIKSVEASKDTKDTKITLNLVGGSQIVIDEADYLK